ncbi:7732_t:CDS:1, partial [Paraglomus occultum]
STLFSPNNLDMMNGPNNVINNCVGPFTSPYQSFYPEDFSFDDPPIHQSPTQDFLPSIFDIVDVIPITMNPMSYEDTGDYTGNYASYQDNPSVPHFYPDNGTAANGQLRSPNVDQAEAQTNSSCPLPVPCQTFYDSSNLYFDTTNGGSTDYHFDTMNDSSSSYIFTQDPTGTGYVVTKIEHTQLVLGTVSAADFNQMLATTRM